jgi:hypothetical protein
MSGAPTTALANGYRKGGNIQRCLDAKLYFYAVDVFDTDLTF